MSAPTLSVESLLEEAGSRAGTGDWGDLEFVRTLDLLLDSCRETAELTPSGWQVLRKVVIRHLRNRLALRDRLRRLPATGGPPARPIVITGLPRTGTTLLHNLLAQDGEHRVLRLWEGLRPAAAGAPDGPGRPALVEQAASWLRRFQAVAPDFAAIHPLSPEGPEECDALLQNSFASQHFDDMFNAERYSRWLATADLHGEYRYYALQLAVLSAPGSDAREPTVRSGAPGTRRAGGEATNEGAPAQTWVLKSPAHLGHLDALLDVLPDPTIVHCHRRPDQAVGSYASLIRAVRAPHTERLDPVLVGSQALERSSLAMQRGLEVRDTAATGRFVDVSYDRLVRDPLGTVAGIYERLDRRLSPDAQAGMRRWLAGNPQHRDGVHRYGLAEFGLSAEEVTESFDEYLRRFGALASA